MPKAKIPLVEFPAALPALVTALEAPTPDAVDVQEAYVYLLRTVEPTPPVLCPNAKIPLVLLPAAAPCIESALETATPQAVDTQVA
jgi:hypothetical protein